jgi:hypothetical protein
MQLFDWDGVANILAQPPFEDLQQIRIAIHIYSDHYDEDDQESTEAFIRGSGFSVFNVRKILDIEFCDEIEGTYY